ncbi:MAG: peptidoglycan recognition family protein [Planctomycetaceae bacterium]
MPALRKLMAVLCLSAGLSQPGCRRRATVPPPGALPQAPVIAPPRPRRVVPPPEAPSPSVGRGNPWKPGVAERNWKSIVIHHTATTRGSVASIHAAHLRRKDSAGRPWRGIGYHFVIGNGNGMRDGAIESTFRWRTQIHGAHAGDRKHNETGIGIALVGNFEKTRPTKAQLAAVKRLVAVLKREYRIPAGQVVGHSSFRATACPGRLFPMAEVGEAVLDWQFGDTRPLDTLHALRNYH